MEQSKKSNQISITLDRNTIINIVLAIQLGLLLIFGWQLLQIKKTVASASTNKVAVETTPTPSQAPTPSAAPSPAQAAGTVVAPDDSDVVRGDTNAKISLIEYSDFECPFCARFHPTAQQAVDEYDGQVNWIYRHFPLSFHTGAQKKAEASNCIAKLGGNDAFWDFTDTLFTDTSMPVSNLSQVATSVGVSASAFESCLDSGEETANVNADLAEGQAAGVTGTPGTIVYNNETGESQLVPGALPYASLQQVIDSLL